MMEIAFILLRVQHKLQRLKILLKICLVASLEILFFYGHPSKDYM
jgi:hypothetical protein